MSVVRPVAGILLMLTFVSVPAIGQEQQSYKKILEQLTDDQKELLSISFGPYYLLKNDLMSIDEFRKIYSSYEDWLAQRTVAEKRGEVSSSIAGIEKRIRHGKRIEINLDDPNLQWGNFFGVYLKDADWSRANLTDANLSGAILINAKLSGAILIRAKLSEADLTDADLSGAILSAAKLPKANLRYADLSEANLRHADLSEANLTYANLSEADFYKADVSGATYEPNINHKPSSDHFPLIGKIAHAKNLHRLTFDKDHSSLVQLSKKFYDAGFRRQAVEIVYAIRHSQGEKNNGVQSFISFILFDLTSAYGMAPLRPLCIVFGFILFFAIIYFSICWTGKYGKIRCINARTPKDEEIPFAKWTLVQRKLKKTPILHLVGCALWFSLLNAFRFGFREFNAGDWLVRLLWKPYVLASSGWCRVFAGIQSLISIYLLILIVLIYFENPFNYF